MIQINRNNYERYLIDYLDGSLTSQDNEIVMLFLKKNPDIRTEMEGLNKVHVGEPDAVFNYKTELKRATILNDSHAKYFEELCIADLEGDLANNQHAALVELLNEDSTRQEEYNLFKLAKLTADESIIFPNKIKIKRRGYFASSKNLQFAILSAAATILILLAVYIFLPKNETLNSNNIAAESPHTVDNKTSNQKEFIANAEEIEKIGTITTTLIEDNNILSKLKVIERIETTEHKGLKQEPINKINSLDISYKNSSTVIQPHLANVTITQYKVEKQNEEYRGIRDFLSSVISRKVFNNKREENLELFHIAQAGVKGINRLVGGEMTLERTFDERGLPKTTEFSSSLVAFSTPVKKKLN